MIHTVTRVRAVADDLAETVHRSLEPEREEGSPVMRWIWAKIFGGELINVTPVQAARAVYGHSVGSFDCVKCPRVLPPMNLRPPICEREHTAAAVPGGGEIEERLVAYPPQLRVYWQLSM